MILESQQVNRLLDILQEYASKFSRLVDEGRRLLNAPIEPGAPYAQAIGWVESARVYNQSMTPAIDELAMTASQIMLHSDITEIDKVSLRVRLAELETLKKQLNLLVSKNI